MARRGFTLVELLVVISLVGFLFLFSVTTLSNFRQRLCLDASAVQLVSDLRRTQIEALAFNETRLFIFNGKQFAFSRTGNPPPGGSGTVALGGRRVIVSSAGRVRVE